ncbi:nitrate/nitrite transporter NrtS [Leptolyngbya sp. 'hensonii']|uniref:nitrate/nitrite transporter NrtS n=1 Tax=Leptolyngbya sp. 'hensonii' TaxID=1922337 RepID=UPI0015C53755
MTTTLQHSKSKALSPTEINAHSRSAHTLLWKVIIIGSLMFTMNHGAALTKGKMDSHRWFSAILGFVIPLVANVNCFCIIGSLMFT